MNAIAGMRDMFGGELRQRRYLVDHLVANAESFGYEPLSVSLVEHADTYSEDVIVSSPWPEWNRKECFFFDVPDYEDSYEDEPTFTPAVLVPEGTLSVTRWLGAQLGPGSADELLPLKVHYQQSCFRNELTGALADTKRRQFGQFGVEILGAQGVLADVEPLILAHEMIRDFASSGVGLVFRISSNKLFLALADASGLSPADRVSVKEGLDTVAECKAGARPERLPSARDGVLTVLASNDVARCFPAWSHMLDRPPGQVTGRDRDVFERVLPDEVEYLGQVTDALTGAGIACEVDFCVVRSHEYYTGLTFEIDLVADGDRHVEVGGGGRYDRLLGSFVPPGGPSVVPSTGFAFGLERLQAALARHGALDGVRQRLTSHDLTADGQVRQCRLTAGASPGAAVATYARSVAELRQERRTARVTVCF